MGLGSFISSAGAALSGGSLVGGLASLGGDLLGAGLNLYSQHEARTASEDMYRRRYQMMVTDLTKAGLNPMLAYMKDAGTPPSVGGGQVASTSMGRNAVASDLTSAEAAKTRAETGLIDTQRQLMQSQINQNSAGAANLEQQTRESAARSLVYPSEIERNTASASEANARTKLVEAELPKIAEQMRNLSADTALKNTAALVNSWTAEEKRQLLPILIRLRDSEAALKAFDLPGAQNESNLQKSLWDLIYEGLHSDKPVGPPDTYYKKGMPNSRLDQLRNIQKSFE